MTDQTLAKLSLFSTHNSTAAARFITMQELAQMAAKPLIGDKAAAPLLTPYESTAKTLEAAQAAPFAALVIDHDNDNRTADDVRQIYGPSGFNVAYLAFTTSSHTQAAPRWKVVVPFACPVDADTARQLSAGLAYSMDADPAQARKQQGFYAPNKLTAGADYQHINQLDGRPWLQPDDGDSVLIQEASTGWAELQELERQRAQTAQARPRPTNTSGTIIERILQTHNDLAHLLEQHGYKRKSKGLYLSPFSSSGMAGVHILERDGKQVIYSHHGPACPLSAENHNGHSLDAADVLAALEYQDDFDRMIKEQANQLDPEGQKQRQREYRAEQERQRKAADFFGDIDNLADVTFTPDAEFTGEPTAIAQTVAEQIPQHPLTRFVDIGKKPEPTKWMLPNFVSEGVITVSGGHGVGKTTTVLPFSMALAGVHPEGYELAPEHWRHVIYITEDVGQARQIITGYCEFLDWPSGWRVAEQVQERFHVVEARRAPVELVAQAGAYYREHFTRTVTTTGVDGKQYTTELLPLVVLDTLAANIEIENENDNAEASKVMACLKQKFAGLPIWIIAHTAKANLGKGDNITTRGAAAYEADAQQVLYITWDNKTNRRCILRGKTRFESPWHDLEIKSDSRTMTVLNRFGTEETLTLRWGIASPSAIGNRAARQEQARAEAAKRDKEALRAQILQAVRDAFDNDQRLNKTAVKGAVTGSGQTITNCTAELIAEGWLYEVTIPAAERQGSKASFLVALDEAEREAFTTTGEIPAYKTVIPPHWKKPPEPEREAE